MTPKDASHPCGQNFTSSGLKFDTRTLWGVEFLLRPKCPAWFASILRSSMRAPTEAH